MTRGPLRPESGPLPDTHWRRYPRVRRPGSGASTADLIDEVVVGPTGVHVVLHRPGARVGDPAVRSVADAAGAVAALLPERYRAVVSAELLLGEDAGDVATREGQVLLASPRALEHTWRYGPRVLSTSEITEVARALDASLERVAATVPAPTRRGWLRRRRAVTG